MLRRFLKSLRSKEVRPERVVFALILIAIVAGGIWFGWDWIAHGRATAIYDTVQDLVKRGEKLPFSDYDVHQAVGRSPSYSRPSGLIELQDDYVFDGPVTAYTVRVRYLQYKGEDYRQLAAVVLITHDRFRVKGPAPGNW
jgi:hypothetical protein